nr:unnamed protein product [Spirometra erinaceieuropaei]
MTNYPRCRNDVQSLNAAGSLTFITIAPSVKSLRVISDTLACSQSPTPNLILMTPDSNSTRSLEYATQT